MANKTVNATTNPGLANKLVAEALDNDKTPEPAQIKLPSEVIVDLPGGYITPTGEVLRTAQVRELNGRDEEAIAKAGTFAKSMASLVSRATIKLGDVPATEEMLDKILSGDRDALMLGIYRATFGNTAEIGGYCSGCQDSKVVEVDVTKDIVTTALIDPLEDRQFEVEGKNAVYTVRLPEGRAQREVAQNSDKTIAELDTLILEYCVKAINGRQVFSKMEVQAIGLVDRRKILKEIVARNPGPKFDNIKVACPDCGGEVVVPINLGTLFRI
jgi:hypothetical protein